MRPTTARTKNRMFNTAILRFVSASLIAASFVLVPFQAEAKTYRVEGKSYRELLTYDAAATRICAQGKLPAEKMDRVIFAADGNAAFSWSRSNPEYYYQGIGWSNCKAYRKKPEPQSESD